MKKLVIVGGSMGVGKSTVCARLLELCAPAVFLDGDWCWNMHPFVVNEENKRMVMGNISSLLRAFLSNSGYETVLFCWVLHEQQILQDILGSLSDLSFSPYFFTLTCAPEALRQRLERDVAGGVRQRGVIGRSLERLPLYQRLCTCPVNVSRIGPDQAARRIRKLLERPPVRLRPALPGDAPLLGELHAAGWKGGYAGLIPGEYLAGLSAGRWSRRLEGELSAGKVSAFVAFEGEQPAGCVTFGAARAPERAGWGEIRSLYLDPAAMGTGLGRLLMESAAQSLLLAGCSRCYLWVLEENRQARGFYEHLGLRPGGPRDRLEIGGRLFSDLLYEWDLDTFCLKG